MIKTAVTISQVKQARGGPFVLWGDLATCCEQAAAAGFDGVELFLPGGDSVDPEGLARLLETHGLSLAAVGTGAGWVVHGLSLTAAAPEARAAAKDYVRAMIDFGARIGAPAIIGSMQGRAGDGVDKVTALNCLADALAELGEHAGRQGVSLLYEPLNRYETNLVNTIEDGVALLEAARSAHVKLLADLFHMNIEEVNIAAALLAGANHIGHIHLADTNRCAVGLGHLDVAPIAEAISSMAYDGYLSAEVLPLPDSAAAMRETIESARAHFATNR